MESGVLACQCANLLDQECKKRGRMEAVPNAHLTSLLLSLLASAFSLQPDH